MNLRPSGYEPQHDHCCRSNEINHLPLMPLYLFSFSPSSEGFRRLLTGEARSQQTSWVDQTLTSQADHRASSGRWKRLAMFHHGRTQGSTSQRGVPHTSRPPVPTRSEAPLAPEKHFEPSSHIRTGLCINPLKKSDIPSIPTSWKLARSSQRQKQAGNSQSLKSAKGLTIHIEIVLDTSPAPVSSKRLTEPFTSNQACRKTGEKK